MPKTNFQIIIELYNSFTPKTPSIVEESEIKNIAEIAEFKGKSQLDLQNLRDFVVCFFSAGKSEINQEIYRQSKAILPAIPLSVLNKQYEDISDKLSAITCAIDCAMNS